VRLPNLLLSVLLITPAAAQVVIGNSPLVNFVRADSTTAGNWKGVYGQDGYVLAQNAVSVPAYSTFNTAGAVNLSLLDIWATDPRALLKPNYAYSPTERVESYFHTPTSMDFLVSSPLGQVNRIALYFCNYQNEGRSESLQALDTRTGALLDARAVPNADGGVYLVYNYSGPVTFRVTNTLSSPTPTAAVAAFFWGGPLDFPAPYPNSDTTPPTVAFIPLTAPPVGNIHLTVSASDNVGVLSVQFQVDGVNFGAPLPPPATGTLYSIVWDSTTASRTQHDFAAIARDAAGNTATAHYTVFLLPADPPAADTTPPTVAFIPLTAPPVGNIPLTVSASDNVGVVGVQFQVDGVNFGAAIPPPATGTLYGVVWDSTTASRTQHEFAAIARDAAGNTATAHYTVFLVPTDPPPVSPNTASFLSVDTRTLGNWKGVYGRDGNVIAQHSVNVPSYATFDTAGNLNLKVLDAAATDPWALLKQTYSYSPAERIESYFFTTSTMDLKVGSRDTATHQIALYFADYERLGRAIVVGVFDPVTGFEMDEQKVPSGLPAYMVWRYTGNLIFRVASQLPLGSPGPTSVLSGLFWDPYGSPIPPPVAPLSVYVNVANPASGTVHAFAAVPGDPNPVTIQYRIDGVNIGGPLAASPYDLAWDTRSYSNGPHVLTAVAQDSTGNVGTALVSVSVNNVAPAAPPVVSIVYPSAGQAVFGMFNLWATVLSSVGLKSVVFQVDGATIGTPPIIGTEYGMVWDSTYLSNGAHTLAVLATDLNNQTSSASVAFNVANSTPTAPAVSILSPANNAIVSGTVTIAAATTGNPLFAGFGLDLGGFWPAGAILSSTPYTITVDTARLSNGPHSIVATATASTTAVTAAITIVVDNPPIPGAQVSFARFDTTTKGNWKGVYGQDGNFIAEHSYQAPWYSTFNAIDTNRLLIDLWSTDPRAPLKTLGAYSPTERVMSQWSSPATMSFQISAVDGESHRVALYFADWRPLAPPAAFDRNRMIRITVLNTDTGAGLAVNTLNDYTGGLYLVYNYRGNVTFCIENVSRVTQPAPTPDATVTAFFWGGQ
jgi:hypothetical protein